jgi:hypothetical protein
MAITSTIGWRSLGAFVPCAGLGTVDSHDGDANWVSRTSLELFNLFDHVIFNSVDLLNHRLRENLHFHADFHGRNLSTRYREPRIFNSDGTWNDLAKSSITTSSDDAATLIARVHDALAVGNARDQSRRLGQRVQIFEEMRRDEVTEAGIAMQIARALESLPEGI